MASKAQKLKLGLLCLLLFLKPSSQTDKLVQGLEIKNGDQLVSAQTIFRLGFFSLSDDKHYLGIWYNDNSRTLLENLVWLANRDDPIFGKSASLTIDYNGALKISNNGNFSVVLHSGQEASNASAVLLDNGNFVLIEPSSGRQLWQSFDYPTHTLLPGMKLGVNWKTGHTWSLRSWRDVKVPDTGAFTFGLHPNHTNQLVILWRGDIYWTSESWDDLNFDFIRNENETYFNYSGKTLTLDFLGMLYVDGGFRVNCTDFYLLNQGCVAQQLPKCRSRNYRFSPLHLGGVKLHGLKFDEGHNLTLMDCEAKCLKNCSCIAYASTNQDAQTGCQILSTGESVVLLNSLTGQTIYFLAGQQLPSDRGGKQANTTWANRLLIWSIVATGVMVIISFCILCILRIASLREKGKRKKKQKMLLLELGGNAIHSTVHDKVKKQNNDRQAGHDLQIFSFESISAATSNFSTENKLGQGGFGSVYKGKLFDGQEIAIKRLSRSSGQGLVEFKNEAILIAKLQHTNLVRLLGFCIQQEEKILIYEYMPNKSLDFFLFDSTKKSLLNWKKRLNIIEGIAQGLVYLHKYSRLRVIHRDLKASNILLDEEMNPKISDFGMARILGLKGSEESTNRIVGTYGYMSPEYAMNGVVSIKTDVFSYGVLLLEIISSKKNNSRYHFDHSLNLVGYAWQLWNEGKGLEIIDPTILDESCPPSEVLRCIHVGLLCVQDQAKDRPSMLEVVSMLSNEAPQLCSPNQPAFFINSIQEELSEVSEIKLENCSINNVTISDMEAR